MWEDCVHQLFFCCLKRFTDDKALNEFCDFGADHMRAAYAHAIAQRYRFYSYGDACLLWPETAI